MTLRPRILLAVVLGVGGLVGVAPTASASSPAPSPKVSASGGNAACFWVGTAGYCLSNPLDDLPIDVPRLPRPPMVP